MYQSQLQPPVSSPPPTPTQTLILPNPYPPIHTSHVAQPHLSDPIGVRLEFNLCVEIHTYSHNYTPPYYTISYWGWLLDCTISYFYTPYSPISSIPQITFSPNFTSFFLYSFLSLYIFQNIPTKIYFSSSYPNNSPPKYIKFIISLPHTISTPPILLSLYSFFILYLITLATLRVARCPMKLA